LVKNKPSGKKSRQMLSDISMVHRGAAPKHNYVERLDGGMIAIISAAFSLFLKPEHPGWTEAMPVSWRVVSITARRLL
jgi:hypothetical protein